ncbi:MAG: glycosyltransferase [Thermoplasmata archaeon]
MRVTILLRICWTGGAQKIAINQALALQDLGHSVRLLFLREGDSKGYSELLEPLNVEMFRCRRNRVEQAIYDVLTHLFAPDRGRESTIDLDLMRLCTRSLERNPPDLLICHDQFSALAGMYANLRLAIPFSVYLHERPDNFALPFLSNIVLAVQKIALSRARAIYGVTDQVTKQASDVYGMPVRTLSPGLRDHEGPPYLSREKQIIAVSMWDAGRKPLIYLDILDRLPGYKLCMAGNWRIPSLRLEFESATRRRGLVDRVSIRTALSEEDLIAEYRRSRFAIRLGFGEFGPGLAALEAVETQTPPVVNNGIGAARLLNESGAGIVVEGEDVNEIAKRIRLADNESAYVGFQAAERGLISRFSWTAHAKELCA